MEALKVLVDLRECQEGFSGIAVDTCRIFRTFNQLDTVTEVGGLLLSQKSLTFDVTLSKSFADKDSYFKQAQYLQRLLPIDEQSLKIKIKSYLLRQAQLLSSPKWLFKKTLPLFPLDKEYYTDFIWDTFFSKIMSVEDFDTLFKADFFGSNLCYPLTEFRNKWFLPNPYLETKDWDIFITSTPINVRVNSKTKKVIRYHDAIPLFYPHLTPNSPKEQYQQLKSCFTDSNTNFVCNSEHTRKELLALFPLAESKSDVIPCSVSDDFYRSLETPNFTEIITNNISFDCIGLSDRSNVSQEVLRKQLQQTLRCFKKNYIICVSTIDPRKNYSSLIRAWAEVKSYVSSDLSLIIVGRSGWKSQSIFSLMQPYFLEGSLIHLSGVSFKVLRILLSNAKAYVFPTLAEGFGIPPIEAMRCGCPTIVSDIDVMKETCGDASIFVNPYDIKGLSQAIARLVHKSETSKALRLELIKKGYQQSEQFTIDNCKHKWDNYLAHLLHSS